MADGGGCWLQGIQYNRAIKFTYKPAPLGLPLFLPSAPPPPSPPSPSPPKALSSPAFRAPRRRLLKYYQAFELSVKVAREKRGGKNENAGFWKREKKNTGYYNYIKSAMHICTQIF